MALYEVSRTVEVAENPNQSRPKLGLGGLRRKEEVRAEGIRPLRMLGASRIPRPKFPEGDRAGKQVVRGDLVCRGDKSELVDQTGARSQALAKSAHVPMPFIEIQGQVYEGKPSWTSPDERRAALGRWISLIVREVGKPYQTKSERDAATLFVRSHRLSIANAFHRKLCRKDVVEELGRLLAQKECQVPVDEVRDRCPDKNPDQG
jgi:hypothetical protein